MLNQIKIIGNKLSQSPFTSIIFFILILTPIVGISIFVLQTLNLMPDSNSPLSLLKLIYAAVFFGVLIASVTFSAYLWTKWIANSGLSYIGVNAKSKYFLVGAILGVSTQLIVLFLRIVFGGLHVDSTNFSMATIINTLIITLSSLNAGVSEEIVFRGVFYTAMRSRWGGWMTAIITSLVFAVIHFFTNTYEIPIVVAIMLFANGMLFFWAREVSGSLWLPIGIHFTVDAAYGWFNLGSTSQNHFLVTSSNPSTWLTGDWGIADLAGLLFIFTYLAFLRYRSEQKTG